MGIPCGPINTIEDVFNHPQAQARDLMLEMDHPTAGQVRVSGFPYKFSATPAQVFRPPPLLGEHNEEILCELLKYSPEEVKILREQSVI